MTTLIDDALRRAGAALSVAQAASVTGGRYGRNDEMLGHIRKRAGVQRAAVPAQSTDDLGSNQGIPAFLGNIRHRNLLDALALHAINQPDGVRALVLASGTIAGPVAEGEAIPVTRSTLQGASLERHQVAALTVVSKTLLAAPGDNAQDLIQHQLETAVIDASNAAVIGALNSTTANGAGDPVADLEVGLAAVADSAVYVVAAAPSVVRQLAVASAGRMGVAGGEFVPGVHVLPVAGVDNLLIIPADRVVIDAGEFELKTSESATVEMRDDPTGDSVVPAAAEAVSMFQTNSVAVIAAREFGLYAAADAVEVGGE